MLALKLKSRSISRKFTFILFSIILIGIIYFYIREFELILKTPIDSWEVDASADCAVVLTGGPGRVKEGLDLLVRRQIKKLIIAGVHPQVGLRNLYPQLALYPQINVNDIVLERRSETTYGNAQQSLPIVEALQCRKALLVTSYIHIRRAYRTFLSTYSDDIQVVPYSVAGSDIPPRFWDLFIEVTKSGFYALWAY